MKRGAGGTGLALLAGCVAVGLGALFVFGTPSDSDAGSLGSFEAELVPVGMGSVSASAPAAAPRGEPGPQTDSVPDPDLLPDAVPSEDAVSAPGQLEAHLRAAGDSYRDPHTGAVVLRLTDRDYPTRNSHVAVDYSNGGPFVSQVWSDLDGVEHITVVAYLWEQVQWWAIDVDLEALSLHNRRRLPHIDLETAHAWSLDPATPRIWYYTSGGALRRYDTDRMRSAERDRFDFLPFTPSDRTLTTGAWLMTSRGDDRIKWEWSQDGSRYVVLDVNRRDEVLTGVTGGARGFNESYLTRDGAFVVGVGTGGALHRLIRVSDGADLGIAGAPRVAYVHGAVIDRYLVGYDTNGDLGLGARMFGNPFDETGWGAPEPLEVGGRAGPWYDPLQPGVAANHESAGWIFDNGNGAETAWYASSGDQGRPISGDGYCAWFICLYQPGADPPRTTKVKHLAYVDSRPGGDYNESAFAHLQPNGRGAVFASVGNRVEGRADIYLALIPRRPR